MNIMRSISVEQLNWIKQELHNEEFYLSDEGVARILAGDDAWADNALVDFINLLRDEWNQD